MNHKCYWWWHRISIGPPNELTKLMMDFLHTTRGWLRSQCTSPGLNHVPHFEKAQPLIQPPRGWAFLARGAGYQHLHHVPLSSKMMLNSKQDLQGRSKASWGLCSWTLWPTVETVTSMCETHRPAGGLSLTLLHPPWPNLSGPDLPGPCNMSSNLQINSYKGYLINTF